MILNAKTAGLVVAMNTALVGVASAHSGLPGHSHGEGLSFGAIAVVVLATSAGLYGVFLKVRDSRKPEPVKVRVRRD